MGGHCQKDDKMYRHGEKEKVQITRSLYLMVMKTSCGLCHYLLNIQLGDKEDSIWVHDHNNNAGLKKTLPTLKARSSSLPYLSCFDFCSGVQTVLS